MAQLLCGVSLLARLLYSYVGSFTNSSGYCMALCGCRVPTHCSIGSADLVVQMGVMQHVQQEYRIPVSASAPQGSGLHQWIQMIDLLMCQGFGGDFSWSGKWRSQGSLSICLPGPYQAKLLKASCLPTFWSYRRMEKTAWLFPRGLSSQFSQMRLHKCFLGSLVDR